MKDYEYELSMALQQKLKKVIKGRIFVNVFRDTLIVQITNPQNYEWEYTLEKFSGLVVTGEFSSAEIAKDIITKYKRNIISKLMNETIFQD